MFKMKCSDFHSREKVNQARRLICPVAAALLMSESQRDHIGSQSV